MKPITPRSLDWIDQAPLAVTKTRRISATPDAVWTVIADHTGWADWFAGVKSVDPGDPAAGVGGTRTVHLGGMSVAEEFLAWDPGAHFAFTATGATRGLVKSLVENVQLTPDGDSATTVSYTMAMDPAGGKAAALVLKPLIGQALGRGLAGLAERAESTG